MENIPDPEIEELKTIVRHQGQVIEETNKMVHSMRRSQRWRMVWSVLWWLLILGTSGAAYYYYVQPYVVTLEKYYANFQNGTQQAQNWEQQFGTFLKQFVPPGASSSSQ